MKNAHLNEWKAFGTLLDNGIPLEDAITFAFLKHDILINRLKAGEDLFQNLEGTSKSFERYLHFFLRAAPMSKAILASVKLYSLRKDLMQKICKQMSYPLLLFFMSLLLVSFFLTTIYPQMQEITNMQSAGIAWILLNFLYMFFLTVIFIALLSIILFIFLWKQMDARKTFIIRYHARMKICKELISYLFAIYMFELMKAGISTHRALLILEQLEEESILYPCIYDIRHLLEKGFSYEKIIETSTYFSSQFARCFQIGYVSDSLMKFLSLYADMQMDRWQKKIKKLGIYLQLIIYGVVAILVFTIYQMLLMPLNMLEQI